MENGCPEYEVYFKTGINKETEFSAHSLWEMLLVVSGRLEMKTFDGSLRTRGAVLALIPPGVHHCHMLLSSGAEYVRYVFYFSPALLTDAAASALPAGDGIHEIVYELNARRRAQFESDLARIHADPTPERVRLMLPLLLYEIERLGAPLSRAARRGGYIPGVIAYISAHLGEKLTAAALADEFGVSRTKLFTDFSRQTGVRFNEYIMRERVARARALLATGVSVAETAERAGFSSDTHMRYCFRVTLGVTPSEYRKSGEKVNDIYVP